jgi:hypothetical protein
VNDKREMVNSCRCKASYSNDCARKPSEACGWTTIAFYGPDASRATKVVVGIFLSEHEEATEPPPPFARAVMRSFYALSPSGSDMFFALRPPNPGAS